MAQTGSQTGRIVVGVDGSEPSARALRWAAEQAAVTGQTLEAVIAWEYPVTYGWAPPLPEDFDPESDARRAASVEIAAVLGEEAARTVKVTVVEGHAAQVLLHAAEEADLLVVGSRGHGGFTGLLLGSVSSHCTTHAHCPVLVVR